MVQRETNVRIRIRTPIIRIRSTNTRILRIIRIDTREEFPNLRKPYCFYYFNQSQQQLHVASKNAHGNPL